MFLLQEAQTLEEVTLVIEGAFLGQEEQSSEGNREHLMARRKRETSAAFRRYVSESGHTILVGKTGKGNDSIVRKKARDGDLWFHAKGAPGAHVVMQAAPGKVATQNDVRKAAALAGYYSGLRAAGKGEIMMTKLKHVRAVRGTTPGKVTVSTFETLMAEWPVQGDFQDGG